MLDWITKPYMQWNILDTILCYLEIAITSIIIVFIAIGLLELKDKIKRKGK